MKILVRVCRPRNIIMTVVALGLVIHCYYSECVNRRQSATPNRWVHTMYRMLGYQDVVCQCHITLQAECLYSSPNISRPLSISFAFCFSSVSRRKYSRINFSRFLSIFAANKY